MGSVSEILAAYTNDREKFVVDGGSAIRRLCRPLNRLIGSRVTPVNQEDVDMYASIRADEGVKPSTIRRELVVLRAAQRLHHRHKGLSAPLVFTIPPSSEPRKRVLTPDECHRLIWESRDHRLVLFIILGLATGGRRTALLDLTWDRIDFEGMSVDLHAPHPRAHRRKGRAVVPISPKVAKQLERFRPVDGSGRVVGLSKDQLHRKFREAATAASLGLDVTPHTLRHTAATTMIRSVPLIIASRMLGHANTLITERVYIHTAPSDLRPAANALDNLFRHQKRG